MRPRAKWLKLLALFFAFGLIAAACGDSDSDSSEAGEDSGQADDGGSDDGGSDDGGSDDGGGSMEEGEATGEPIKIGFQNPEGDPNGSFPEYSASARAAAEYINTELGGLGGRPIELVVCEMAITPDDSQRCANELVAEGVEVVISSLNFFGNHMAILNGAGVPVIVGTPITVADFTSPDTFSIGAGGGCFGVHTGMVQFATQIIPELEGIDVNRVAVPWADTPPGVVCYYDLESKPLDVIKGAIAGSGALAGSNPNLEHIGVPILPASADVTPQATEVLDFNPDVIHALAVAMRDGRSLRHRRP